MSVIDYIVPYALKTGYEDLNRSVTEVAKKCLLDTLGVIIAGSSADEMDKLVYAAKKWWPGEESKVFVYGLKVGCLGAAFANATMARARDLDDVHEGAPMHVSAAIVPAALTICEYRKNIKGKCITGREFITGVSIGADFLCRLRLAGPGSILEGGWTSETAVPLAIALMGGKLLDLDEKTIFNCLGIAYAQCAGNLQAHREGASTVRLQQGMSAMSGMLSLLLAERGFAGPKDILEGKYGYYNLYMRGQYRPEMLTSGLGDSNEILNVSIKSYPCCRYTHSAIFGALDLAKRHKINWQNIRKIRITTNTQGFNLCGGENKRIPTTVPEAQFSYFYTVATALVKGYVFIDSFTQDSITDKDTLSVSEKIEVLCDPEKDNQQDFICPADIDIKTDNGGHYRKSVKEVKGHPINPMSFNDVAQKVRDCARFSAVHISDTNVDRVIDSINHLEEVEDVNTIPEYLIQD